MSEDNENYLRYFTLQEWAHCYRGLHRNTNMALEKWHQEIKHNFRIQGRCQTRFDKSLKNIIECLRLEF